jgi:peptidoglycan/xylan/chitin deacetylase (PgdA/CDA1 family)
MMSSAVDGFRAVLTYHSIDESGSVISLAPEVFAAHVRSLVDNGIRVLSLADLIQENREELPPAGHAVALTFDDGFANFGVHAAPILADHGMVATLFVVSGHVGGTNGWRGESDPAVPTLSLLDWDSLGRLAEAGNEIGAHTRTHPSLDDSRIALDDEIEGGAVDILRALGRRPTSFAYPYGRVSRVATEIVRSSFDRAVTTEFRSLTPQNDRALLPRLDAYYFRSPEGLAGWGGPQFRAHVRMRGAMRAVRARLQPKRSSALAERDR